MTGTNGATATPTRVGDRRRSALESLGDDNGLPGGPLAISVVVAHEDSLPRDIIARACAQLQNLRVVGCVTTAAEIMASCVTFPPQVVAVSDSIAERFEEVIETLLAVETRIVVICTNPSLEQVIRLLDLGVHGVMLDDSSPLEIATGVQAVARGG